MRRNGLFSLIFIVLLAGAAFGGTLAAGNEPLLGLDLQGGVSVVLAPTGGVGEVALAGAWHLVAELGFAPSVDECAACHATIADDEPAPFGHTAGGVLCRRCAALSPGGRPLPGHARAAIRHWSAGERFAAGGPGEVAAHQRLLRLFLQAHLADGRPLPAYEVWEQQRWGAA